MISQLGNKFYVTMTTFWLWWWEVDNERDELARAILTISVPTLILVWYKWTFSRKRTLAPFPPGPYGLPVIGYLPFMGSNIHEIFTDMAHRYGPIFSLRLGSKLHVVVSSVELAKAVARDQDDTFANRTPPLTALIIEANGGPTISWSDNSTHWRNMRKLLVSQVTSPAILKASQHFRTHEVRKTVSQIYGKLGENIDINKIAFETELNVVTSMLWGSSKSDDSISTSLGDGFREVEFKMIELLGAPNVSDFLPMLSWFDLQGRQREMQTLVDHADRILDTIIQGRIAANYNKTNIDLDNDQRKDFLQILLDIKDQKDAPLTSLDPKQIQSLFMEIVIAGTDTTSTMTEWVMAEIMQNPEVKTKIHQELTEVFGMNIVEESHLHKLSYLDAVIKETFRLHPPLNLLIPRSPNKSCTVGGYTIPKGTIVYMNVWAIQRDPKNWTNPLEFKPERFLNGKWDYNGNNLNFFPFGSGRRMCPGMPLGEKMLKYILASLLHSFEWSLPEDEELDLSDEFGFVTKKRKPLIAVPSQRLSDASLYLS